MEKLQIKWKVNKLMLQRLGSHHALPWGYVSDQGRVRVPECMWVCVRGQVCLDT